ncbi:MAG: FtsX-like permease family protein [Candidatus Dadabacteria bacterium]|nr:MAG: FtsX-like permease family protein [Candidatus Dadabacteria bacterium]
MLRLLRQISFRYFRASWGRTLLIVGGVAVGITLISAINLVNSSVLANVRRTIDLVAGPAALEVTMGLGEVGFDEDTVEVVRATPGVEAAVPLVRGTISLAERPAETLQLYGVDFTGEEDLGRYTIAAVTDRREILAGFADPYSVLIAQQLARELGLGVRDKIRLATPTGIAAYTIRGLLDPKGLSSVFGGRLAVMDLPAAQIALGKGPKIDQIDVVLQPEADIETVRASLLAKLPPGMRVRRPEQRGKEYEKLYASFQVFLTGLSALCLIAGVFIVYNATATGTVHRAFGIATLQHVGGDRDVLARLLLVESLVLGVLGSAIGLTAGVVLAKFLNRLVTGSMGVIFQLQPGTSEFAYDPVRQAAIGVVGVVAALVASFVAARRVTRLEPLDVIRGDRTVAWSAPSDKLVLWWLFLVAMSVGALYMQTRQRSIAWGNFGATLWFAASIVIALPLVRWLSRWLEDVLPRRFGPAGRIAAESLFRSTTRTGVTISAIALVLTIAVFEATMARSFRESVNRYFASGFLAADLTVSAASTSGGWLETPISEEVAVEIESVPGVRSTDVLRILPGQPYRGERIAVAGLSDGLFDLDRYPSNWFVEGDPVKARKMLLAGTGARISVSLSDRFNLHPGDPIVLETPRGPLRLFVADVVPDYMSDRGGVGITRRLLQEWWGDSLVNRVQVFVADGVSVGSVRSAIQERLGGRYNLKILSLGELLAYHERMINKAFAFTNAIQILVVIVTVAGIFDLLLSAILERRREIALWQVVGADRTLIEKAVVLESGTIGALGVGLGLIVGIVTSWIWVRVNFRYLIGYYLQFHFALDAALWSSVLALTMATLSGFAAARQAARQPILEGIHAD